MLEKSALTRAGIGSGLENIPEFKAMVATIISTAPLPFIPNPMAMLSLSGNPDNLAGIPQPSSLPAMATAIRTMTNRGAVLNADKSTLSPIDTKKIGARKPRVTPDILFSSALACSPKVFS